MTKAVWMRDEAPERARVEPPSPRRQEERVLGPARELGSRFAQVAGEAIGGFLAQRNDPLLAALAAHPDELLLEVDVGEVEPDGLRASQSGRVDELEQGAVA